MPAEALPTTESARKRPLLAITATAMIGLIVVLAAMKRVPWCEHGIAFWTWQSASACTSQHLGDPYSLTHVEHGFIFYGLLTFVTRWWSPVRRYAASTVLETLWEIVENTPWVIDRYREQTAALGYTGDSILNSCGDLLACCLGYLLAAKLPTRWVVALAVVIELGLLLAIRDNLTLNVVMLLYPLAAIQRWQLGS